VSELGDDLAIRRLRAITQLRDETVTEQTLRRFAQCSIVVGQKAPRSSGTGARRPGAGNDASATAEPRFALPS
jgi:hypothetical protein